jgi:5-methylcytosine-specific restriction endonuclease McrA
MGFKQPNFNKVLVLDTNRKPLMPCYPARAKKLLSSGHAAVFRRYPFTIILHDRTAEESVLQEVEVKIGQGPKTTGVALIVHGDTGPSVSFAAHIEHRNNVKSGLDSRRAIRHSRRRRKTRYRQARFLNRTRPKGWLPPSLLSKANNILNWVIRFNKLVPITKFALETAKFDTQKLENPNIQGVEYQQGRLYGYADKKAYLLERERGCCIYCGIHASKAKMQIDHVMPRSKGGTNSLNNLVLSCNACNQAKGSQDVQTYLKGRPSVLKRVKACLGKDYKDAAHTNSIRLYVIDKLQTMADEVDATLKVGFGSTTKQNRLSLGLPKDPWIDAAVCTSDGSAVKVEPSLKPLIIKAVGRGSRQFCRVDKYGFPRTSPKPRSKNFFGFKTGDMVKVIIPDNAKTKVPAGTYTGRVAVRSSGHFDVKPKDAKLTAPHKYCKLIHLMDGYSYA